MVAPASYCTVRRWGEGRSVGYRTLFFAGTISGGLTPSQACPVAATVVRMASMVVLVFSYGALSAFPRGTGTSLGRLARRPNFDLMGLEANHGSMGSGAQDRVLLVETKVKAKKRADGTGCVYARRKRDGTLYGWWIKFYRHGEQIVRNAETKDRDEAKALLARLLGEQAEGAAIPRTQLTLEGAVKNVERTAAMNGRTANPVYRSRLIPYFKAKTKMAAITTARMKEYIEERLKEGARNATINREIEAIRRAFTLAHEEGAIHDKPRIFPRLDERGNVRTGFFDPEQFAALVAALRKAKAEPLIDVVTFAYVTGWRLGEVLGLRRKHVDLKAGTVRLDPGTTKNKEGRTFFMTADLRALVERRLAARPRRARVARFERPDDPEAPLFAKKNGVPIGSFRTRWHSACRAAGIADRVVMRKRADGTVVERRLPGLIFHDFRRTAVRRLERAGVARSVAMKLVGHKTESIYRRYAIVSESDLREAVEKLGMGGFER